MIHFEAVQELVGGGGGGGSLKSETHILQNETRRSYTLHK